MSRVVHTEEYSSAIGSAPSGELPVLGLYMDTSTCQELIVQMTGHF